MQITDHLAKAETLLVDKVEPQISGTATSWRTPIVLVSLTCLTIVAVLWHTAFSIGRTWYASRTFSHGFMIIPMFVYLAWLRRDRIQRVAWKPAYWVLAVVVVTVLLWGLGDLGDVRVVEQFALVAIVVLTIWAMLGTQVARAIRFPLLLLFFAVPFGESVIGPLQDFTARFAVYALRLSQVPVILDYRTISIPSGTWIVAEACSGIRYLFATIVVGLIYASFMYQSTKRRALFLLACIVVPIIANGMRAYGIIMLAHLTNNKLAVGVDHIVYGWLFLTLVQLLLFSVGLRWREFPSEKKQPGVEVGNMRQPLFAAAVLAICAVGLVTAARGASIYLANRENGQGPVEAKLAVQNPWQQVPVVDFGWVPMLHASSEIRQSYASGGAHVDVYIATYSGGQPIELVGGYNQVSEPGLWNAVSSGTVNAALGSHATPVRWTVMEAPQGHSRMVWSWYFVGGKDTASNRQVKFLQAKERLLGRPAMGAYVTVSAEYLLDASKASGQIQDFLNHASIQINGVTVQ